MARMEHDRDVQRRYASTVNAALGWGPGQHVAMWPPVREFVRRGTSATTVGDGEPVTDR
jgi:hypothetical protein